MNTLVSNGSEPPVLPTHEGDALHPASPEGRRVKYRGESNATWVGETGRPAFLGVREVKAQIGALLAAHPDISEDLQLLADTLEGSTDLPEVMNQLVKLERDADIMASAIRVEEARLAERRERYATQKQKYRDMMSALLEAAGQRKQITPTATVTLSQGKPGVAITDPDALADQYVRIKREPNKTAILEALLMGDRVAGAELRNSQPHITIRT